MTHRLTVLVFGITALSVRVSLFAGTTTAQPVQATTIEHVTFAPGGTIRLNNSFGYLSVEGWDHAEVEVSVVKSMGYDSEPAQRAAKRLESTKVVSDRRSDTELAISTTRPARPSRFKHPLGAGRQAEVEYRIRVPRNSHLVISHARGYVSVTGITGNIEATDSRGDIVLALPKLAEYSIEAHTQVGVVTSDVAGATHNKYLLGERFTRGDASLTRRLSIKMGFGGITIKELPQDALAPAAADGR